jgi:FAD/FMN-containing dehydrogenase
MHSEIKAAYVDKLVLYENASMEVCCWGRLPVDAEYYKNYDHFALKDAFGRSIWDAVVEAQHGWIREDHLGQTHEEYLESEKNK